MYINAIHYCIASYAFVFEEMIGMIWCEWRKTLAIRFWKA